MTKFKVGDKVRILDVGNILAGDEHWSNGDVTEVIGFKGDDTTYPILKRIKTEHTSYAHHITPAEYTYVEIITEKPTKKQRIEALEKLASDLSQTVEKQADQIAELQSTIAKLREALS